LKEENEKEKEKEKEREKERATSPTHTAKKSRTSISYYHSSTRSYGGDQRSNDYDYRGLSFSSAPRQRSNYPRRSPPRRSLDLLHMTYEDYLNALGQLNNAFGIPEMDHYSYMNWYSKQQNTHDRHYVNSRSKR